MTEPTETSHPQPFRVPDNDLDDLASALAKTVAEVRQHGALLDRLSAEPDTPQAGDAPAGPSSVFILALGGDAYATELAALSDWVNHLLLSVYGREISTARPWCERCRELPGSRRAAARPPAGRSGSPRPRDDRPRQWPSSGNDRSAQWI